VRNFVGLRDFTPMDRDTFNTRFSEPMPQPPPSLQDYVTSAANAVREAGDPKRSPSATQRNVERAQAAAERQYPSIVSQYDKDLNAWNKRRQDAYTLYKNDLTKGREGYYNQPFSARAPMASIVAGYGIPAVAAAASYGKMRADRSRAVSGLTDEIASGSLSPSAEALKRNELTALKATVPQGIFGDIAERARYAAPGMALSSVERVGEDIVDRMATPADAGARQHVVDRYTDLSKLPGTVVDYALRAGLPFAMTGVAGFGPAIKPQVAARSDAVLNDGGRAIAAGDISQSRGLLRSIDEDAALRSRLADEAARQEQAVLEELAAAGPTPEVRQRVTNALAQRGQTQLPSQPFQPSLEAASNRALPSPNAMLSDTPQPRQNQGFSLSPPPNGGPAVRDPMPIIAVDQTIPDPRQLSMDLSFKEGLRELPSTYRPIVEREFRAAMSDPVKRQIITSGNFADQLTRAFAEAGLPPIPPAELVQRIENLFQGTRSVNRTMMNTRPRSDGTPRFHVGQTNVQDAMFGTNGPHQSGLWDPRFTFGIAGAAASGPVLNPMLQQYYGD
jgi:hypothetical protein